MTKKRILFISPQPYFQWRGSPIRVRFVLQSFSDLGYEVDLLTLPFGEDVAYPNMRIFRVPNLFGVKNVAIGPSIVKALFDLVILYKAIGLLRKNQYDIIHGVEEGGFLAVMLSRWFKTKSVFEKHSDPFSYRKGLLRNSVLSLYALMEKYTIRRAGLVICTGHGLAGQARKMGPKGGVITIFDVPSSLVEASDESAQKKACELRKNESEILATFVGSFAVYQGVDLLFESIPYVLNKTPNIRFIIIGGTEQEIAEQRTKLAQSDLDQRVTFVGKVPPDELPDYLKASDILLSPRHSGVNTPLKILDYFKAGRAIVATDVISNRLILNEQTALFAEPSAEQYGDKILQLVEDDKLCSKLGDNGLRLYQDKYNLHGFKYQLKEAYQTIFKEHKNKRSYMIELWIITISLAFYLNSQFFE